MRNYPSKNDNKLTRLFVLVVVFTTSSCATLFVRSESTDKSKHVYPATVSDANFFWDCSIKGDPPFKLADSKVKTQPFFRAGYGVAAVIDLPFSIVSDTIMLPVDLHRSLTPTEEDEKINASENDYL